MFTGLIADLGSVASVERDGDGARIEIATRLASELEEGDSIAVDGVCLTATEVGGGSFAAQAMRETLDRSALGALTVGARVNLELPLRAADRLGGHVVQGHVDGIGTVSAIDEQGFARVLGVASEESGLGRYLVEKGSVAVNGVSLTVSALRQDGFEVSLIPETLQRTNLGMVHIGDKVNLETDVLAKHVERLLEAGI
jgi:riboflavin synthase